MRLDKLSRIFNVAAISLVSLWLPLATADDEKNKGDLYITSCNNAKIKVTSVNILCNSPGDYYYGGSNYRNSETCMIGDKVQMKVGFTIAESLSSSDNGNNDATAYMTLQMNVGGTKISTIYNKQEICSINNLKSSYGGSCPATDMYYFQTSFYLSDDYGSYGDDSDVSFTPDVTISFTSNGDDTTHDLGYADSMGASGQCYSAQQNSSNTDTENTKWWMTNDENGEPVNGLTHGSLLRKNLLLIITLSIMVVFAVYLVYHSRMTASSSDTRVGLIPDNKGVSV